MTTKKLIIFTDSGDTIIDEGTQIYDERGIVQEAQFIPGAGEVLRQLHEEGFTIALVADGEWESFQNVYRKNGLGYPFGVVTDAATFLSEGPSFRVLFPLSLVRIFS